MYEKFIELVRTSASCVGVSLKDSEYWAFPDKIEELEAQAARLNDDEIEDFVDGDEITQQALIDKHDIRELNEHLNYVFESDFIDFGGC